MGRGHRTGWMDGPHAGPRGVLGQPCWLPRDRHACMRACPVFCCIIIVTCSGCMLACMQLGWAGQAGGRPGAPGTHVGRGRGACCVCVVHLQRCAMMPCSARTGSKPRGPQRWGLGPPRCVTDSCCGQINSTACHEYEHACGRRATGHANLQTRRSAYAANQHAPCQAQGGGGRMSSYCNNMRCASASATAPPGNALHRCGYPPPPLRPMPKTARPCRR